jgi:hypothetical protein
MAIIISASIYNIDYLLPSKPEERQATEFHARSTFRHKISVSHFYRFDVVARKLAYYARCREFDSHTVQIFVCACLLVLGLGVSMYNMYVPIYK